MAGSTENKRQSKRARQCGGNMVKRIVRRLWRDKKLRARVLKGEVRCGNG